VDICVGSVCHGKGFSSSFSFYRTLFDVSELIQRGLGLCLVDLI